MSAFFVSAVLLSPAEAQIIGTHNPNADTALVN
jgi:hypothetical protein